MRYINLRLLTYLLTKLTKKCGSEFGALLWRHLTSQRKTAVQIHNCTSSCTQLPKIFRKIYFLYDFWCAQTCSFRAIFGLPMRNLTFGPALYRLAKCGKKNVYRCTSTFLALKYCSGLFEIFQISIRSGVQKLFCRFLNFSIFDRNTENCGAIQQRKCELSSPSERATTSERKL